MFPSIFVRPEAGLISSLGVFFIVALTFLMAHLKKALIVLALLISAFFTYDAFAFMAGPGVCGSTCLSTMPRRVYGPVYYPQFYPPWMSRYPSYPRYPMYGHCYFCMMGGVGPMVPHGRSIQSLELPVYLKRDAE